MLCVMTVQCIKVMSASTQDVSSARQRSVHMKHPEFMWFFLMKLALRM